jgi:hypothetical protein
MMKIAAIIWIVVISVLCSGVWFFFHCSDESALLNFSFMKLKPPPASGTYLLCPKGYCHGEPNAYSPILEGSVIQLYKALEVILSKQPRLTVLQSDLNHFKFVYRQRTGWLRLSDGVVVQLLPVDARHATIAIYSQSCCRLGFGGFDANRMRVEAWLGGIVEALPRQIP